MYSPHVWFENQQFLQTVPVFITKGPLDKFFYKNLALLNKYSKEINQTIFEKIITLKVHIVKMKYSPDKVLGLRLLS